MWAPRATTVTVRSAASVDGRRAMYAVLRDEAGRPGWFAGDVDWLLPGVRYWLSWTAASAAGPAGAAPSRRGPGAGAGLGSGRLPVGRPPVAGRDLSDGAVLYELHVGTWTEAGTLDSAAERLGVPAPTWE